MFIESKENLSCNISTHLCSNRENNEFAFKNKIQKNIKKANFKNSNLELNESPFFSSRKIAKEQKTTSEQDASECNFDENPNDNDIYYRARDLINLENLSFEKHEEFLFSPEIGKNIIDKIAKIAKNQNSKNVCEENLSNADINNYSNNINNKNVFFSGSKENQNISNNRKKYSSDLSSNLINNVNSTNNCKNNFNHFNSCNCNGIAKDNFKLSEVQNNLLNKKRKVSQDDFIPSLKRYNSHNDSSNCSVENINLNSDYEVSINKNKSFINNNSEKNFNEIFFNNGNNIDIANSYDSDQELNLLGNVTKNNPNKNLKNNLNKNYNYQPIYSQSSNNNYNNNNNNNFINLNFNLQLNTLNNIFNSNNNIWKNSIQKNILCQTENFAEAENYNIEENWSTKMNLDSNSELNDNKENNKSNYKVKKKSDSSSQMSINTETNFDRENEILQKEKEKERESEYNFIQEIKQSNRSNSGNPKHLFYFGSSKLFRLKKHNLIKDLDDEYFQSNADSFQMTDGSNLTVVNEDEKISLDENYDKNYFNNYKMNNNNNNENQFIEFVDNKEDLAYFNFNNLNNCEAGNYNDDVIMRSNKSFFSSSNKNIIKKLNSNSNKNMEIDDEIANAIKKQSTKVKILLDNNFDLNFNNLNINSNNALLNNIKEKNFNSDFNTENEKQQKSFKLEMLSNCKNKLEEFAKGNDVKNANVIQATNTFKGKERSGSNKNKNYKLKPKFYSPNFDECVSTCIPDYYKNLINDKGANKNDNNLKLFRNDSPEAMNVVRIKNLNDLIL